MDAKRLDDYGKANNLPKFKTVAGQRLYEALQSSSAIFNIGSSRVLPRNLASGTLAGTQQVGGGGNVNISGANKNITMNDGTNDRLLIGYQQGGF